MEGRDSGQKTELISGDGVFNEAGVTNFAKSVKLDACGVSYAVVAIMGPQSSGKSTLLNHLFHTNFKEMDANMERKQTTKGIWIAKAPKIEPLTLVLDLEGTDGAERGEDDKTFEKQSAIFALAVADIVLINMWHTELGREQGANRPLLKTIFEVTMRMFSSPRKTTLLFVIRDKPKRIPFEISKNKLMEDIQKIWDIVPKTNDSSLSVFYNVEVIALSNYDYQEDQFIKEVGELRNRFSNSITCGGIAGDRRGAVPGSRFHSNAKNVWETIKRNKDLNLPTHKIIVASLRCDEIAKEKLDLFKSNKEWLEIKQAAEIGRVNLFGATVSSILEKHLSSYDSEAAHFDEKVRNEKRQYLVSEALRVVYPAYTTTLGRLRWETFENFKTQLEEALLNGKGIPADDTYQKHCLLEFDQRCSRALMKQAKWDDASTVRKELVRDIQNRTASIRTLPLAEHQCRVQIASELERGMDEHLGMSGGCRCIQWSSFRSLLKLQIEAAGKELHVAVAATGMDQKIVGQRVHAIEQSARNLVETKLRNAAADVQNRMLRRHQAASKEKKLECLKLLSTIAVLRFEEDYEEDVEKMLVSGLIDKDEASKAFLEYSTKWKGVPPQMTLITPTACKDIWKAFANTSSQNRIKKIAATTLTVSLALLGIPRFGMKFFDDDDLDSAHDDDPDCVDQAADSAGDELNSFGDALQSVGDFALQMF